MSSDIETIIARCTRGGITSWRNVAAQLGCSEDSARSRHDPAYLNVRPWPVRCERVPTPCDQEPIDLDDAHSLAHKGPGMKIDIVCVLQRLGALSVEAIAGRLNRPKGSVRMRLSQMRALGWVENDSRGRCNGILEWTWTLTEAGIAVAVTECAVGVSEAA